MVPADTDETKVSQFKYPYPDKVYEFQGETYYKIEDEIKSNENMYVVDRVALYLKVGGPTNYLYFISNTSFELGVSNEPVFAKLAN